MLFNLQKQKQREGIGSATNWARATEKVVLKAAKLYSTGESGFNEDYTLLRFLYVHKFQSVSKVPQ